MDNSGGNLRYYAARQCSSQWRAFLAAFANELGQQIPPTELRILMARFGRFMAQNLPTPSGDTLAALEASINSIWFEIDWGWASLVEKSDGLYIEHHAAPLQSAFGTDALPWSPAILEGAYAHWFSIISAGSPLQLTQVGNAQPDALLQVFRFGRAV